MSDWISVQDMLPENDPMIKKYIEGTNFGVITVLAYNGVVRVTNRFFVNTHIPQLMSENTNGWVWALSDVTHWMPLPEPPKEAKCATKIGGGNKDETD